MSKKVESSKTKAEEPSVQLATRVPKSLRKALRLKCAETGESQMALVTRAIQKELKVLGAVVIATLALTGCAAGLTSAQVGAINALGYVKINKDPAGKPCAQGGECHLTWIGPDPAPPPPPPTAPVAPATPQQ